MVLLYLKSTSRATSEAVIMSVKLERAGLACLADFLCPLFLSLDT